MTEIQQSSTMPTYSKEITFDSDVGRIEVLVRYYTPWGDGSINGWQQTVQPPIVRYDNVEQPLELMFGYEDENYRYGQNNNMYDQHSQYFRCFIFAEEPGSLVGPLNVSGMFVKAAYFSVTLYISYKDGQRQESIEWYDYDFDTAMPNPYIKGNPSVFSYDTTQMSPSKNIIHKLSENKKRTLSETFSNFRDSSLPLDFYRPSAESGMLVDEMSKDGCSKGYIIAKKTVSDEIMLLRMKLPFTFIRGDNPDLIFSDYECQDFTIGAFTTSSADFDFWTVNSRMLNSYIDDNGYVYVFFAPVDFVRQLITEQSTPATVPPILTWGNYTGYVFGPADESVTLRYRGLNDNWSGNPQNCTCYLTDKDNLPVTKEQLGDYYPELYGDSMSNFYAGNIGPVNKDSSWPPLPQ